MPQTLKLTQNSSDCVLQIISFNNARAKKKYTHLKFKIFQPSSVKSNDLPSIFFKSGSFVKNLPNKSARPKSIFIIVGFT